MTKIFIHQTHHTIADFDNILEYLTQHKFDEGLHLFPESFLTGHPLQDLILEKIFIENYLKLLESLDHWAQNQQENEGWTLLLGGIHYERDNEGLPLHIKNVIYYITPGNKIKNVYSKRLLPNYDIFDEQKYYSPGLENKILNIGGKNIALMICEDMWASSVHCIDPVREMAQYVEEKNLELDLIVNLSASPFFMGKEEKRLDRAKKISTYLRAPFAYVNRVGGEDETLFDGRSFLINGQSIIAQGKFFKEDLLSLHWPSFEGENKNEDKTNEMQDLSSQSTWKSFLSTNLKLDNKKLHLRPLTDEELEKILKALEFGIQEYAKKCGFKKFTVALSGGIDSSIVLALMKLFLKEGQELDAIYMPGFYSAKLSDELAYELCEKLSIKLATFPISSLHSAIKDQFHRSFNEEMAGLADENIQSRLRGGLLYARSNQLGSMVLNTSNKSEIAVGYSTLYGDSVGALSPLGDLYKTEVFELARYINKKYDDLIPQKIITRPPSAELRENQEDSQGLPPYHRLDAILEGLLNYRYTISNLTEVGYNKSEVEKVYGLYMKSEYKRKQFCPILKLKAKSFGFGHRMPITRK